MCLRLSQEQVNNGLEVTSSMHNLTLLIFFQNFRHQERNFGVVNAVKY